MKRHLVLLISLFSLLLSMASMTFGAQPEPFEVVGKKDDLEEIQLKSRLEDRLARDIQAYLGHERFIINVDVNLQKIRQVIKQGRVNRQPDKAANFPQDYPKLYFPKTSSNVQEDVSSLPGLPYMDIQGDKEKDAELQFMREQITRLQKQKRQPQWGNDNSSGGSDSEQIEKTIAVFNKIKNLFINLLIEESISKEQEVFLRNLIYQKAALNDLRGDKLTIVRTKFSAVVKDNPLRMGESPAQTWMDENFSNLVLGLLSLLAFLLLALIVLSLRKKTENEMPAPSLHNALDVPSSNNEVSATIAALTQEPNEKQHMLKTRQDVISLGLGQPQHVQFVMDQLISQEDKVPMVASLYKVLGGSLFRSIFPNITQQHLQRVMTYLADQGVDEDQQKQDLQDFHEMLKQRIHNTDIKKAHPFDFLEKLNDSQVLYLIQHEDARIQALVVSQLEAEQGARLINKISTKRQAQVIAELGQFETFPLDTFQDVADRLAKASTQVPSFENVNADGLGMLINMLDNMSSSQESKVLKRLRQEKPDTFHKLRLQYFTFSDLSRTPRQILSNALREVDRSYIGRAICNTPDDFKLHVLTSLTPKLKALAREDLKRSEGRIGNKEIDEARKAIVSKIREYINTGKFSMDMLQKSKRAKAS